MNTPTAQQIAAAIAAPSIVALDLSLACTGWCTTGDVGTLSPPDRVRGVQRLAWIRDAILERAADAALIVIEGYGFAPGRGNAARELGELGGVVRLALYEAGHGYVEVSPASLKKYSCGRGNAPKNEVLAAAIRRLGYAGHSGDEADALWLHAMALDALDLPGAPTVPALHREALAKIAWPSRDSLNPKRDQ